MPGKLSFQNQKNNNFAKKKLIFQNHAGAGAAQVAVLTANAQIAPVKVAKNEFNKKYFLIAKFPLLHSVV